MAQLGSAKRWHVKRESPVPGRMSILSLNRVKQTNKKNALAHLSRNVERGPTQEPQASSVSNFVVFGSDRNGPPRAFSKQSEQSRGSQVGCADVATPPRLLSLRQATKQNSPWKHSEREALQAPLPISGRKQHFKQTKILSKGISKHGNNRSFQKAKQITQKSHTTSAGTARTIRRPRINKLCTAVSRSKR